MQVRKQSKTQTSAYLAQACRQSSRDLWSQVVQAYEKPYFRSAVDLHPAQNQGERGAPPPPPTPLPSCLTGHQLRGACFPLGMPPKNIPSAGSQPQSRNDWSDLTHGRAQCHLVAKLEVVPAQLQSETCLGFWWSVVEHLPKTLGPSAEEAA